MSQTASAHSRFQPQDNLYQTPLPVKRVLDPSRPTPPSLSPSLEMANRLISSQRTTNRYSALQSLIADQDTEIEDELARGAFSRS